MKIQLSKNQKKVARSIIEKGLQKEYVTGIEQIEKVIARWRTKKSDDRETWFELYKEVTAHDKNIARQYDNITGSRYLLVIMNQLMRGVIGEEDLAELDPEISDRLMTAARQY